MRDPQIFCMVDEPLFVGIEHRTYLKASHQYYNQRSIYTSLKRRCGLQAYLGKILGGHIDDVARLFLDENQLIDPEIADQILRGRVRLNILLGDVGKKIRLIKFRKTFAKIRINAIIGHLIS